MSTILKALRRLEEQKSRDGAPRPLREEIASGPGERSRRRGAPWMLIAALVLGAGLGASVWWFWPYERVNEPLEVAAAEPATRTDPIGEPAPLAPPDAADSPVAAFQPSEPVAQDLASMTDEQKMEALRAEVGTDAEAAFASLVEVVKRPPAEPRIAPVEPGAAAQNERRQAALARQRSARAAAREAAPAPAPAPAQELAAAPRAASRAPAPAPAASNSEPAPSVREDDRDWPLTSEWEEPASGDLDAPRGERSSPARVATTTTVGAEDVRVKRTQWHPEHARRSAELAWNGKDHSVHEGDVVGEYVVQEIKPSGVVLTRYGEQFERRVGAK